MKLMQASLIACVLGASPVYAYQDHTASWFVAHPREMDAQISACLDDPGHGKSDPNCANASQGQAVREAADARSHFAAMGSSANAEQEQMWRAHPQMLLVRLKMCNVSSPQVRPVWDCDRAYRIAQQLPSRH